MTHNIVLRCLQRIVFIIVYNFTGIILRLFRHWICERR